MLFAVEIVVDRMACLSAGFDEEVEERVSTARPANGQRPFRAMKGVVPLDMALRLAEIGKYVRIAPTGQAELRPAVIVATVAAYINHAVDCRGAAQSLAARPVDTATVELRFGLPDGDPLLLRAEVAGEEDDPNKAVDLLFVDPPAEARVALRRYVHQRLGLPS